jgi:hypothetical protein
MPKEILSLTENIFEFECILIECQKLKHLFGRLKDALLQ